MPLARQLNSLELEECFLDVVVLVIFFILMSFSVLVGHGSSTCSKNTCNGIEKLIICYEGFNKSSAKKPE